MVLTTQHTVVGGGTENPPVRVGGDRFIPSARVLVASGGTGAATAAAATSANVE